MNYKSQEICGVLYQQINFSEIQKLSFELNKDVDIIPGVYEGGFKVWECTLQLIKYFNEMNINFDNQIIIDIGCGLGLLGIYAIKQKASNVFFQDYNEETYQIALKKQMILNFNTLAPQQCQINFISGDWIEIINKNQEIKNKFDIAMASEVIYREENYSKIIQLLNIVLKIEGICYMINKAYYFGVGGSVQGFKQQFEQQDNLILLDELIINDQKSNKRVILIIKRIK